MTSIKHAQAVNYPESAKPAQNPVVGLTLREAKLRIETLEKQLKAEREENARLRDQSPESEDGDQNAAKSAMEDDLLS